MVTDQEKNIFLQELEEESAQEGKKSPPLKKKHISATAIFAATFIFFLFIVVLLVFVLGISGSGSPVFKSFGIEAFEVKNFLKGLINKVFTVFFILLLLSVAIGLFRGYSFPKEEKKKRKGSFLFAIVAGGLIFLSVVAWQGTLAFVEHFVVDEGKSVSIEMINIDMKKSITAPIDIKFSAEKIVQNLRKKGYEEESFRWSQDNGDTFTDSSFQDYTTLQFFTQGKQKIILQITLKSGNIKEYEEKFIINSATFEVSPSRPRVNKQIKFLAGRLVPSGKSFQWDFNNDGEYEKQTRNNTISYSFDRPGEKTIRLRVEKKDKSIEEFERKIFVLSEEGKTVIADISLQKEPEGTAPFEILFNAENSGTTEGEITQYTWRINPGSIVKKGISLNHTFEKKGKYTVRLTVENNFGETDSVEIPVHVKNGNSPPEAIIISKPSQSSRSENFTHNAPFFLEFSAEKSLDPDENITQYQWEIVDQNSSEIIETIEGSKNSYTFREEGAYQLILTVIDSEGEKSRKSINIKVIKAPIKAAVYANPQTGTIPLVVEFNGSESSCKQKGCKILSFEWDFKDGSPIIPAGAHISHEFTSTGTFDVEMKAITNLTNQKKYGTVIQRITVTDPSFSACFEPSRSSGVAPLIISFNPSTCSKGEIVRYAWDFGDSIVSSQKKPRHTYSKPGVYTATLKTFDKNGRVSKYIETITVQKEENTEPL